MPRRLRQRARRNSRPSSTCTLSRRLREVSATLALAATLNPCTRSAYRASQTVATLMLSGPAERTASSAVQPVNQHLADIVLVTHVLFVAFVVVGLLLTVCGGHLGWAWIRNIWFRGAHLAAIGFVVLQTWLGMVCPLTTLEMRLRVQTGPTRLRRQLHRVLAASDPVSRPAPLGVRCPAHRLRVAHRVGMVALSAEAFAHVTAYGLLIQLGQSPGSLNNPPHWETEAQDS